MAAFLCYAEPHTVLTHFVWSVQSQILLLFHMSISDTGLEQRQQLGI